MSTVNLHRRGAGAILELNRPETMNAWTEEFGREMSALIAEVGADPEVRAVMVTGAGRGFSSGADLKAGFKPTPEGHPDVLTPLREAYHPILTGIRHMAKPVIAAVNGPAVGIGCSLALCCDLVLAAESAYFLLAFANIGLVPDGGSSLLLPARAGHARAVEMAMLAERIPARQAQEWGLVNRVHPDDELREAGEALLDRLAAGPTRSYAGIKRQLNAWMYRGMEEQLELEATIQQEQVVTGDFMEGVTAFLQKRPPEFGGS